MSDSRLYKGYEIETDADGHITVWAPEHCEHWTETSVDAAKARIDDTFDDVNEALYNSIKARIDLLVDPLPAPFAAFVR